MRSQISLELQGHIAERVTHGDSLDAVLQKLGDPVRLAESYLSAEPLVSAPVGRRALAKVIDAVTVLAVLVPFAWAAAGFAPPEALVPIFLGVILIGGSLLFGVYVLVAEYSLGWTLGKNVLGLCVVRESGARISLGQSIVRQLPLFLQICWIDAFFALFTAKSQRAFELLSKTRVVLASPPAVR